jgi:hypothetical protein
MGDDGGKTKGIKSHESTLLYPVTLHSPRKEVIPRAKIPFLVSALRLAAPGTMESGMVVER